MKIRMFLSVPIKDTESIRPVLEDVRSISGVRAAPISQMHITVRFIGDIDDGKTKKVVKAIQDAVSDIEPFTVSIRGAGCFPKKENPSVIWIGAHPEDTLRKIADRISANLKASSIRFDEKPFKAHITVGRCSGRPDIGGFLDRYGDKEFSSFVCDEILVMRSELSPSGAKHTVLERVPLGGN